MKIEKYIRTLLKAMAFCLVILPITTCKHSLWKPEPKPSIHRQFAGIWISSSFYGSLKNSGSLYKALQNEPYRFLVIDSLLENKKLFTVRIENYNQIVLNNSFDFQLTPDSQLKSSAHFRLPSDTLNKAWQVAKILPTTAQNTLQFKTFNPNKNTYTAEEFVKISNISSTESMYLPSVYINSQILTGTYTVFNELDSMIAPKVIFRTNGIIHGWQQFTGFKIEQYYEDLWKNAYTDVIALQMPGYSEGNVPPIFGAMLKIGNTVKIYKLEYANNKAENYYEKKQLIFTLVNVK